MRNGYKGQRWKKVSPDGWEPCRAEAGTLWACRCPPLEGSPESSGAFDIFQIAFQSQFLFYFLTINLSFASVFLRSHQPLFATSQAKCRGQPWRQPQAWRQQIVHFRQAWSTLSAGMTLEDIDGFIEMVFQFICLWTTNTINHRQKLNAFLSRWLVAIFRSERKTHVRTHHGLNSFHKVRWGCGLTRGARPLGARA